jgi:hypothetical protein
LVLPRHIAPAASSRATTPADAAGCFSNAGQPAVVGRPPTSMLSFTAKGMPQSGRAAASAGFMVSSAEARARSAASGVRAIHTASSPCATIRVSSISTSAVGVSRPSA